MIKPQIVAPDYGAHNLILDEAVRRVKESSNWKKMDCILLIPAGGQVPTKAVASWLNLLKIFWHILIYLSLNILLP
jgi:hypothetical protein